MSEAIDISAPRIERLRAWCKKSGVQAFYVRDTSNICWLTAFDDVFDSERAHVLLITPERVMLHTDSRYVDACNRAARGSSIEIDGSRKSHATFVFEQMSEKDTCEPAAESGEKDTCESIAENDERDSQVLAIEDSISLAEYRALEKAFAQSVDVVGVQDGLVGIQTTPTHTQNPPRIGFVETSDVIVSLRAIKNRQEIARMRAAQAITDAAFSHIVGFIRPGMTEREVQIELEDYMLRHGAQALAFSSIVASGANGASPHAIPGETVLEAGQCVVLDFGARARGYCSDMTRTVFLGEPDARLRGAYETLRQANEEVERTIRPGVTGKEMHELAERVLAAGGYEGCMGHGLGHGVGIDIHEEPCLNTRNDTPLVSGNVVTVEPGIYLSGEFGMRLEDFGVVTDSGFDVFTQSSHDMVIL